jgi:DNA modification methylase
VSVIVLRGDAACLPLPGASVDLIVTSPPYFGLRSYSDNGEHYAGQVGSEATPVEFIAALLACTREWVRVLKPQGSIFVNLGDKYASGGRTTYDATWRRDKAGGSVARPQDGMAAKSLIGLPWRYAIGCMDDLGLILRAEIVWHKPNGLPESVTDRVRRSHEQVFHFTRSPRYFAAVDEVREQQKYPADTGRALSASRVGAMDAARGDDRTDALGYFGKGPQGRALNPLGKLPGSVWEIPSAPLKVPAELGIDHFAAYPPELCRRIVLGWSPPGICTECGEGRRPVGLREQEWTGRVNSGRAKRQLADGIGKSRGHNAAGYPHTVSRTTITGYACACPDASAPARPALVLDPFGGTGTTALVADMHGRTGVTVDRSADYCRLAAWRTADPAERARALGVPKPPPVFDGQEPLFTI